MSSQVIAFVAACVLCACSRPAAPAEPAPAARGVAHVTLSAEALAANGVQIESVAQHELQPVFRVPARVAFNQDGLAHVGCAVKGRVSELRAHLGDDVESGAVLLVVESPELGEAQSEYLQKRSAARTGLPALELARASYERGLGLHERNQGISLSEVQKRESEYRAAQAAQQAAENKLRLLGMDGAALLALANTGVVDARFAIRAPIAGQVIEREVTLGELVGPERESLLVLADLSRLWVLADVPEARLRETAVGARARVLLGIEQAHWCEGVLSFIAPALDPGTRSVRVRIEVADRHPDLRPGVFAEAEIASALGATTELAVPETAIQTIEGRSVVFVPVAGAEGSFAPRVVRLGRAVGQLHPLLSGLHAGERYVSAGSFILKAELGRVREQEND